jgi:hypothetical protein
MYKKQSSTFLVIRESEFIGVSIAVHVHILSTNPSFEVNL